MIEKPITSLNRKELKDYIELSDFDTFKTIVKLGNRVKAIKCPNASSYSRKVIDELTDWLKKYYNAIISLFKILFSRIK